MAQQGRGEREVVAGLFQDRERAAEAIRDLRTRGFAPDELGAAMRDRSEQGELIADTASRAAVVAELWRPTMEVAAPATPDELITA